jgi:methyl coenzyme M reductase subunit C-like uncharacterized protein (methanogenesis marker protein 7)
MNPELEKLIDLALADGVLTEKEKEILIRKANESGMDMDEFEMVLDGKLHLAQKSMQQTAPVQQVQQTQSNKEGDIKKCPSCGLTVKSFTTKCGDCGHEFRNTQAISSVNSLFEKIQKIDEDSVNDDSSSLLSVLFQSQKKKRIEQKISLISNFPVPNTKEDLLEFLIMATPQAKQQEKLFFIIKTQYGSPRWMADAHGVAWFEKCKQIIMKARLSMKDDKKTLEEIEYYAKQLNIK